MNAMTWNELKRAASNFWNERNKRERNMLSAAAVVIVLGLLYALLIDPALSGRRDLERKLPALRQQAAEVQALAKEASALGSKAAAPVPEVTRESIENSLSRKGIKSQSVALTGDLLRIQLNGASFSGLVDWLEEMRKSARLSVVDANITAQEKVDTVNATLTLRQQRGAQ